MYFAALFIIFMKSLKTLKSSVIQNQTHVASKNKIIIQIKSKHIFVQFFTNETLKLNKDFSDLKKIIFEIQFVNLKPLIMLLS